MIKIFGNPHQHLLQYAIGTRDATTNTWGWPAITLCVTCQLFGATLQISRMQAVIAGTAMVVAMFFLVYRLIPDSFPSDQGRDVE
jgi:hypothetical protein